ncbi:MAG: hypothetical protein Q7U10_08735 [Thermodesulfovibrionia bacterium]|nr:hypothetical protein [Thermodesulfovibrionia bacterium]
MILKADGTIYESKAAPDGIIAISQLRHSSPQGPMTDWFNNYVFRKIAGEFYEVLREGIPIIDAAISRLISLEGTIKIIGDNAQLVRELEDFHRNIPVGDMQTGINAFHRNMSNEKFEQGFALPEIVATKDLKDVQELRVPDSKYIIFRRNKDGRSEPWYRYPGDSPARRPQYYSTPLNIIQEILTASYGQAVNINGVNEVKLNPANKIYFSMNNENTDPHGVSLMRSMEFCANILVTLENAMKNSGDRFGDPSYHIHLKGAKAGNQTEVESRRKKLEADFTTVIETKRAGQSADLVTAGSADSDVSVSVIGHDGQLFNFMIPIRHASEQILAKTGLAAWSVGLYWGGAGGKANIEAEMMLADAKVRGAEMLPGYIKLFSTFLQLRGYTWKSITTSEDKPGDWGVVFETPNIRDLVTTAQARFLNAQADMMQNNAGMIEINSQASVEIGGNKYPIIKGKTCGCKSYAGKEFKRPLFWPDLDDLETKYETKLKDKWRDFENRSYRILSIDMEEVIKSPDKFIFTEIQKKDLEKALDKYLKGLKLDDLPYYYGQAYSLGLIAAAYVVQKEDEGFDLKDIDSIPPQSSIAAVPILDIIKNREIFEDIVNSGFDLVKDKATSRIKDEIITEIESAVAAGKNPKEVASILKGKFSDANSDWERLARSELSMAAERAKLDEWGEWEIKEVEFAPAPDACPICRALAGDYPIADCPIPVKDTHPRCRCSTRPAESETR